MIGNVHLPWDFPGTSQLFRCQADSRRCWDHCCIPRRRRRRRNDVLRDGRGSVEDSGMMCWWDWFVYIYIYNIYLYKYVHLNVYIYIYLYLYLSYCCIFLHWILLVGLADGCCSRTLGDNQMWLRAQHGSGWAPRMRIPWGGPRGQSP